MKERFDHTFNSCSRTYATLCIYSNELPGDEFSLRLGIAPDRTVQKGQKLRQTIAERHGWFLGTQEIVESNDLAAHIQWLLDQLSSKREILHDFQNRGCEIRIMCFWESATGNGGPVFDHQLIQDLGKIPIDLHFDIWFDVEAQ